MRCRRERSERRRSPASERPRAGIPARKRRLCRPLSQEPEFTEATRQGRRERARQLDFEFSDEQGQLRESVRRFLEDRAPIAFVREMYDDERGTTDAVWGGRVDLGAVGLLVPEEHGGAGMGMVDAAVVLEELGRAVHPGPYASSAIGTVSMLVSLGDSEVQRDLLPGLADGSTVATVALHEPGRRAEWEAPDTKAVSDRLTGEKVHVHDAAAADVLLVTASTEAGELGVYAVDAENASVTPTPTVDGTRKEAHMVLDDVPAR